MASIFARKDSPWYWLRFKSPTGQWKSKGTRWLVGNPLHRARAIEEAAGLSVREKRPVARDDWILPHIQSYPAVHSTMIHYRNSWRWLQLFMTEQGITSEQFTPAMAEMYIPWRISPDRRVSGRSVHRNQALRDIKIMKWIHRQGRLLGRIHTRELDDYRLKYAEPRRIKPVFTPEQIDRVRIALANLPAGKEWMRVAFEISLATGCRLAETQIPLRCVDLDNVTITFPSPKGGAAKSFTVPIPATLRPMLTAMKKAGLPITCRLPAKASTYFRPVFDRLGLYLHCFHCLRVTRASNLRRAGVPIGAAMRLLNHGSELVHEMYVRHEVEDLRGFVDAGQPPPPASGQNPPALQRPARWGTQAPKTSAASCRRQSRKLPPALLASSPG